MDETRIINGKKLSLTNLDKIYWPKEKYTKGDLINYYQSISKFILPYLKNRPESLNRFPNGIKGASFYQKDVKDMPPEWIKTVKIYSDSTSEYINYLVCQNEATLIYMANLGCIEINPWFSNTKHLEKPDYMAIDLDPEDISFDSVIEAALAVKEVLDRCKAIGFVKTSGATGIHIYIPLNAKYDFDTVKDFAHVLAEFIHELVPGFTSLERSPAKRKKKVYIDFLQNRRGQTLAAPYSVRPRPMATVSTPLHWKEVKQGLTPQEFTIKTIHKRVNKTGDIFSGIFGKGIDIVKCLNELEK